MMSGKNGMEVFFFLFFWGGGCRGPFEVDILIGHFMVLLLLVGILKD